MADKTVRMDGSDGSAVAILAHDTSTTDDKGREVYTLGVDATFTGGDASAANQLAANVLTGPVTETAPATDTASSGLNGRLQRLAQRITSLIALLPTALGTGGGLKVDGSGTALPVSGSVTADTELPAASALNGTIAKSVSAPMVGAGIMYSDGTNLIEIDSTHQLPVDTELAAAVSLTGTNAKSQTVPIVGAANLISDGTNLVEVDSTHPMPTSDAGLGLSVTRTAFSSSDASSTPVDLTTSPSAGLKAVAVDIIISVVTACTVNINTETTGLLFSIYMGANQTVQLTPRAFIKGATAAKKLQITTSVASVIAGMCNWYTEA